MKLLKFLLTYNLKNSQRRHKTSGFTLIELIVGMLLAFLIITPLMGFVINMMDTDRKEQAKATSEQEIQAALDYIARDIDQAFFIYDGTGLAKIKAQLPSVVAAGEPGATGEPVLVFWKRQFLPKALPIEGQAIGSCTGAFTANCDDGFVYSLVAYYQIKDNNCANTTWSCTTRISRVELKDALYDVNNNPTNPVSDDYAADAGLVPIDQLLNKPGSLSEQLTDWTDIDWAAAGRSATYEYGIGKTQFLTLIDYIDQTPAAVGTVACSDATQQVPDAVAAGFPADSFYACVDTAKTVAQVFIRGNALARLNPKSDPPVYAAEQQASYFPTASIQAQGSGLLNENPSSP